MLKCWTSLFSCEIINIQYMSKNYYTRNHTLLIENPAIVLCFVWLHLYAYADCEDDKLFFLKGIPKHNLIGLKGYLGA